MRSPRASAELGEAITRDYAGRAPVLVGVLKGALVFVADLIRAITLPVSLDFMSVSSYGSGTRSSGRRALERGPLAVHRGAGRDHRRGHHRQRADHQLPPPQSGHAPSAEPRAVRAAGQGGPAGSGRDGGLRGLRHPGRIRGRATAWTTTACTGTSRTSRSSTGPGTDLGPTLAPRRSRTSVRVDCPAPGPAATRPRQARRR